MGNFALGFICGVVVMFLIVLGFDGIIKKFFEAWVEKRRE